MNEKFIRPKYDGTFIGQTQTTNAQTVVKHTCFEKDDPETGEKEKCFGKVTAMETIMIV